MSKTKRGYCDVTNDSIKWTGIKKYGMPNTTKNINWTIDYNIQPTSGT